MKIVEKTIKETKRTELTIEEVRSMESFVVHEWCKKTGNKMQTVWLSKSDIEAIAKFAKGETK